MVLQTDQLKQFSIARKINEWKISSSGLQLSILLIYILRRLTQYAHFSALARNHILISLSIFIQVYLTSMFDLPLSILLNFISRRIFLCIHLCVSHLRTFDFILIALIASCISSLLVGFSFVYVQHFQF